jgi:hypothetical protein
MSSEKNCFKEQDSSRDKNNIDGFLFLFLSSLSSDVGDRHPSLMIVTCIASHEFPPRDSPGSSLGGSSNRASRTRDHCSV